MKEVRQSHEEEKDGQLKKAGVIQKLLNWVARGAEKERCKGGSCQA